MPNIIKTVTLQAGEQFTLPPGATLISATDIAAISSTCDTGTLEELKCYLIIIAVGDDDNADTILWDASNFKVKGWRFNGIDYNDLDEGTTGAAGALSSETLAQNLQMSANSHGILAVNITFGYNSGDGDNGTHNFIVFKSIPSVASKLEIKVNTGDSFITGDTYIPSAYLKPILLSEATGLTGVPTCP